MNKDNNLPDSVSTTEVTVKPPLMTTFSLSVVLPAYNEEDVIADTVEHVDKAISTICPDYEIIIVDDGSIDRTGEIIDGLAVKNKHVSPVHNRPNRGYGGALIAGFSAAEKDLIFFMDADGQFDIEDIKLLLPYISSYDAVLGFRKHRRDPLHRKINAFGWNTLVHMLFGLKVRDVDCAFKLYHAEVVRRADVRAEGAMINTEMLVKLTRLGYRFIQVGVHHYPRIGGKATGANLKVIFHAFKELIKLYLKVKKHEIPTVAESQIDIKAG